MKDKKFIALSALFFLMFAALMGITAFDKPISGMLRAKNVNPSALKSFVIVFPQVIGVSDNLDEGSANKVKVTVFIRDNNGGAIPNRNVKISSSLPGTLFSPSDNQVTNNQGMAQFFISGSVPGTAQLAVVDTASNTTIVNVPTVEFK